MVQMWLMLQDDLGIPGIERIRHSQTIRRSAFSTLASPNAIYQLLSTGITTGLEHTTNLKQPMDALSMRVKNLHRLHPFQLVWCGIRPKIATCLTCCFKLLWHCPKAPNRPKFRMCDHSMAKGLKPFLPMLCVYACNNSSQVLFSGSTARRKRRSRRPQTPWLWWTVEMPLLRWRAWRAGKRSSP